MEEWDVSQVTNHLILMLIWITIRIHEFLTEFIPLQDAAYFTNFTGSAPLVEICAL